MTVRTAPPSQRATPYASFSSYVRVRRPVLLRTARSLTNDPGDAEDLLQTVLARTYLHWDRITDHGALDGYVRRALVNARTSQWRRRRVEELPSETLPEPRHPYGGAGLAGALGPADPAESQAVRDALWQAVLRLPDRQRAIVVLRYYEDLSEARTAELLGVSAGTVKSALSRALVKLRSDPELHPAR